MFALHAFRKRALRKYIICIFLGTVTEISGADKLASLRAEMENFVGLSFDTISSIGPNGAIIHYKPSTGK